MVLKDLLHGGPSQPCLPDAIELQPEDGYITVAFAHIAFG
jgi:hypothetical protein